MKKYEYTVFGTATTVKVMKFDEFPKPGQTTPILNTNFDRLYYGGKAWNIVYDLMMLGLPVYPVLAYSDARFEPEFQRAAERFQMPTDGIFRSPQGNYEFLTCYVLEDKHKDHITLGGYHSNAPSLDLAELKRELNKAVGYKGVQIVTISRPTAYGEYAPYCFVDTEKEFETLVKGLRS